jgi:hypothetical protein
MTAIADLDHNILLGDPLPPGVTLPIVNAATYYHGIMIADVAGVATKVTAASGLKICGYCDAMKFVADTTKVGLDSVSIRFGIFGYAISGTDPVTVSDQRRIVYAEGDNIIARTSAGGTLSPAGILERVVGARAYVNVGYFGGDSASVAATASFGGDVANTAALQAVPAVDRFNGQKRLKLDTDDVWTFDSGSAAAASDWVIVPDAGTGRWLRKHITLIDLSATTTAHGAGLIGIEDVATIFTATTVEGALAETKALVDAGMTVLKKTVTVGHADLTDADGSQAINIGTALPNNARIVGVDMRALTAFSGGTASAVTVDVGTSGDVDALIDGADVFAAAVDGGPATMPAGIRPNKMFASGGQLIATFAADDDVADLSAGSVIIDVLYTVLA